MLRIGRPIATLARGRRGGVIVNEHTLTPEQTLAHVELLARWFEFISHDELVDRFQRPGRRPFCLLTFDDGKRSNATQAAPELERLGVPAVFYLTTGFVSDGTPLWYDRYTALVQALGCAPSGLDARTVKELPLKLLEERLGRACELHHVRADSSSDDVRPMSWDDARSLARRGFTIGAHSRRHATLPRETEEAALADIEGSIADVTAELKNQCTTFAFPNGNYTARLARHALACGVRTVMTTEPVWARDTCPLWRLPRIQLFGSAPTRRSEMKLALAATGRVLENPDGTGRLYRLIERLDAERPKVGAR